MNQAINQWMVRRKDCSFLRPMHKDALIKKIETGELMPDDEICQSAGYWVFLQDASEVRKLLGDIKLDRLYSHGKEDVTSETSTAKVQSKTVTVAVNALKTVSQVKVKPIPKMQMPEAPEAQTILKGLIFVLAVFSVFILMLISFWLSTY